MVRKCQMWQGKTLLHFLFSETEWWEKTPKQIKQHLHVTAPCSCPGRPCVTPWHRARGLHGLRVWLWVPALHCFTQHSVEHPTTPSEAPGCQIYPLPMGAESFEASGGILRPAVRKGRCVSRHDAGSRLSPSIRAPPASHLHR